MSFYYIMFIEILLNLLVSGLHFECIRVSLASYVLKLKFYDKFIRTNVIYLRKHGEKLKHSLLGNHEPIF